MTCSWRRKPSSSTVRKNLLLILIVILSAVSISLVHSPKVAAASEKAVIGMPFDGKWAYNVNVNPPYTDTNSSHPSVHPIYGTGYNWSTDVYAPAGTDVLLKVSGSTGTLSYSWVSTSTSCGASTGISISDNGVTVGTYYIAHMANVVTSGTITNGMKLGDVANLGCNPGKHVHVEFKSAINPSCWTDHGNPGVTLSLGTSLGILGTTSATGNRQACPTGPADTDGDGFVDSVDQCPTTVGTLNGCPDADGDGIADASDACPSQPGPDWKSGCPIIYSETEEGATTGDFDNDGYKDYAVGAPGETVNGQAAGGIVNLIYGSSSGLNSTRQTRLAQEGETASDLINLTGTTSDPNDDLGSTLTSGDFNNDGYDDLVIGVPNEDIGSAIEAGLVHVVYGTASGITSSSTQKIFSQGGWTTTNLTTLSGTVETKDWFGATLAAGDINGDGYDDLVIGVPGEDIGTTADAGLVHVIYGSSSGLSNAGENVITQGGYTGTGVVNVLGTYEADDYLGGSLVVKDLNKDGKADIVIGVPSEDIVTGSTNHGLINVIFGASGGLTTTGQFTISQGGYTASTNIALSNTTAEQDDYLGASLAVGDINGDTYNDLVIGVPGEDIGTTQEVGLVDVIYGTSSGITASSSQHILLQTGSGFTASNLIAVGGTADPNDRFGSSVAIGDIDGDGYGDLAISVPTEMIGTVDAAGMVNIAYGSSAGISSTRQNRLMQSGFTEPDVITVSGTEDPNDFFSASLVLSDVTGDGKADVFVGSTGEDILTADNCGFVNVVYGSDTGFGSTQNTLTQHGYTGTGNIELLGTMETGDYLGGGMPTRLFF